MNGLVIGFRKDHISLADDDAPFLLIRYEIAIGQSVSQLSQSLQNHALQLQRCQCVGCREGCHFA